MSCLTSACPKGQTCIAGFCIPAVVDLCASVICLAGSTCQGGVCFDATAGACSPACATNEVCNFGSCTAWLPTVDSVFKEPLLNTNVDLGALSTTLTQTTNALAEIPSGTIVNIGAALSSIDGLTFGCSLCTATNGALLLNSQTATIGTLTSQFRNLAVALQGASMATFSTVNVNADAQVDFTLDAKASLDLNSVNIASTGVVTISGSGSASIDVMPAVTRSARIVAAGAATLSGNLDDATLEVKKFWTRAADASIQDLETAGDVLGTGLVTVLGTLRLASASALQTVTTPVAIQAQGTLDVRSYGFSGARIDLAAGGTLKFKDVTTAGATLPSVDLIGTCEGAITFDVASLAGLPLGQPQDVFRFGAATSLDILKRCTVQISGSDGSQQVSIVDLASLPTAPAAITGRRLLANTCTYGAYSGGKLSVARGECQVSSSSQFMPTLVALGAVLALSL